MHFWYIFCTFSAHRVLRTWQLHRGVGHSWTLLISHRKPHTQSKDWPILSSGTDIKVIDYNSYLMVLSLISRLFIGLSTRVDSPWTVAVEMPGKLVLSFSSASPELLSKGVQLMAIHASKTSDKKLLSDVDWAGAYAESARWFRWTSSWKHTPSLLVCSVVLSTISKPHFQALASLYKKRKI